MDEVEVKVEFAGRVLDIKCPSSVKDFISRQYVNHIVKADLADCELSVRRDGDTFSISSDSDDCELEKADFASGLKKEIVRTLVEDVKSGAVLSTTVLEVDKKAVLVVSSDLHSLDLATSYLTERRYNKVAESLTYFPVGPEEGLNHFVIDSPPDADLDKTEIETETKTGAPRRKKRAKSAAARRKDRARVDSMPIKALLFPQATQTSGLHIEPLPGSDSILKLQGANLNTRNLADGGLSALIKYAEKVPSFALEIGKNSLDNSGLDKFFRYIIDNEKDAKTSFEALSAFSAGAVKASAKEAAKEQQEAEEDIKNKFPIPEASPAKRKVKLTIGMATFDDYDGVYFTIQAIRINNPELMDQVEFLIVDNNPTGDCAKSLKSLEGYATNVRYVPYLYQSGTSVRNFIFAEAAGEFILCMDCHVLLAPGALKSLLDYYTANPTTNDLLHGPLMYDNQQGYSTHFKPVWRQGMYGIWSDMVSAQDLKDEPIEIPMQGLGLFTCRAEAWPGFNPKFKGFGGEEGYIHQKFKNRGNKVLCLPQLKWLHRFQRPKGVPYRLNWEDRIRNYLLGWTEAGMDVDTIKSHFTELLNEQNFERIKNKVEQEMTNPFNWFDAIYCINADTDPKRWQAISQVLERFEIKDLVMRIPAVLTPNNHHIGCALSHRKIIQEAARQGLEKILVLEDDCIFHDRALSLLPPVTKELETTQWDVLYLGAHTWGRKHELVEGTTALERVHNITCTQAIAYNHSVYQRLLDAIPDNVADMEQFLSTHHGIDKYYRSCDFIKLMARPVIAMQESILYSLDEAEQKNFS